MTTDIYKETILDHYRHPRNFGDLPNANGHAKDSNNLCGDVIEMQARVNAGMIEDVRFRGEGCAISMATAAGVLGSFAIMRKLALASDPISHIALPGIGIALLLKIDPIIGAAFALVSGALIIWNLEKRTNISTEALIGVIFSFN